MQSTLDVLRLLGTVLAISLVQPVAAALAEADVSFNHDIRPLLAAHCFACHGPDEEQRQADLRLDVREQAIDFGAIVPAEPDESELLRRVMSEDADERMPPAESGEPLTEDQIQRLRRWIADGAEYEEHWAFTRPVRPKVPDADGSSWPRNEIDYFVLGRLRGEDLQPSREADRYALVRRVYLDLIGLPPTPEEADEFAASSDPKVYEHLVDELLKSKSYGERWARQWLDLARYADTHGYEKDRERSIWPYRDWVIRALNADMPFDQFTIEQIAGDMLPDATPDQQIATGFHRNTMLNEEGGIDPLEYRFYAMVDRVATTGTVWMGLTIGCAQCHSHKYDPISHTDYYRLMALMNNADEPDLVVEDAEIARRRNEINRDIERLVAALLDRFEPVGDSEPTELDAASSARSTFERALDDWLQSARKRAVSWTALIPRRMKTNLPQLELLEDGSVFSHGDITKRDVFELDFRLNTAQLPVTALRLEVLPDPRLPAGGPGRGFYEGRKGDFFLSEISASTNGRPVRFKDPSHSYGKISVGSGNADAANVIDGRGSTGWSTSGREGEPHQLVLNLSEPVADPGDLHLEMIFERHFAASLGRFRFSTSSSSPPARATELPVEVERILTQPADSWTESERQRIEDYFLQVAPQLAEAHQEIDELRAELPPFPTTMVMHERRASDQRRSFRHHRGEYLSPREEVSPGIPEIFPPLPPGGKANRLEFARWLASDRNPLIARVTVNRAWQAFFGTGIVETSGDFGTQADPPSHPELLDWLACQFMDNGWSLKKLHRTIVCSATYRQSSHVSPALLGRDPRNRLLARGPRHRVDAEMVRDIMLKTSGLLSSKMYGPSVFPPQPASVTGLAYGSTEWNPSTGSDRYRRSLYTFSKRTAPFAAFKVFDSPTGESCIARRNRSNTPMQALTLLNDEMFLEMARALATEAVKRHPDSEHDCATFLFRRVLTRPPEPAEVDQLVEFQQIQRPRLEDGKLDPAEIASGDTDSAALAAWIMVARVVINLDEAITKP